MTPILNNFWYKAEDSVYIEHLLYITLQESS